MHSLRLRATLLIGLGSLLSACSSTTTTSAPANGGGGGGPSASAAPTPKPTPAGSTQTTTDFTITMVSPWTNRTSTLTPSSDRVPLILLSADAIGAKVTNSNDQRADLDVARLDPALTSADFAKYLTDASTSFGTGADASTPAPITLGGESGMVITYAINTSGTPGKAEDIIVNHNGKSYNFTFTDSLVGYSQHLGDVTTMLGTVKWVG